MLFFLSIFVFILSVNALEEGVVLTPFGYRLKECVLEVPHNAHVKNVGSQLHITEVNAQGIEVVRIHTPDKRCNDDIEAILDKQRAKRGEKTQKKRDTQGWLDYGGWYPNAKQNNLQSFTSTYVVPNNPPITNDGQTLFYFIGFQDNDAPGAVNIVQPVLTWGNGYTQWYAKSWACCPANITVSSPAVFGLNPGSKLGGIIHRSGPSTWAITSTVISTGQKTTLNAQVGNYQYNWADVTLEVYSIAECGDFAPGKAYFNQLVMTDKQGQTLKPQWQFTPTSECGGEITQVSPTSIYIQHTN